MDKAAVSVMNLEGCRGDAPIAGEGEDCQWDPQHAKGKEDGI